MDLSLLFLHRQGLAGRPRPTCSLQGSSRRSGRFPALSSAGANWVCSLGFNCGWPAARVEDTEAAKRQKKRRHLAQSLAQQILRWRFHVAEKAERQDGAVPLEASAGRSDAGRARAAPSCNSTEVRGPTKSRFDGSTRNNSATHQRPARELNAQHPGIPSFGGKQHQVDE
jgi:hypothetical protein